MYPSDSSQLISNYHTRGWGRAGERGGVKARDLLGVKMEVTNSVDRGEGGMGGRTLQL